MINFTIKRTMSAKENMNSEQIKKLFEIFKTVDGGCSSCVRGAINKFCESFPEHEEEMIQLAIAENEYPFDDPEYIEDLRSSR